MAGIEQLEIHSKSYIVRWVKVDEGHTISWSVQPHKKSINFGIVKHPGTGGTNLTTYHSDLDVSQLDGAAGEPSKAGLFAKKDANAAPEQLRKKGFNMVKWHGKCDADKVSMGTFDVVTGNGGMFGLVFDNTFSKQTSKSATFVLLTYPTDAPPQGTRVLPNLQAGPNASSSRTSLGKTGSAQLAAASESAESLNSGANGAARDGSGVGGDTSVQSSQSPNYHVGTLMKRRRKKGQGYARRFFSLDFATCTLSYYHNRSSSALRGAIPLSLAAIAADERRREITIDSGAEVWHLKASNVREFTDWARALERASRIARGLEQVPESAAERPRKQPPPPPPQQPAAAALHAQEEHREWQQVEALVSRVVGTRDALRRLVKDMAAAAPPPAKHAHFLAPPAPADDSEDGKDSRDSSSTTSQPLATLPGQTPAEKRSFWRRRSSASPLTASAVQSSVVASSLAVPTPTTASSLTVPGSTDGHRPGGHAVERSMQDHCEALLTDLDSVVAEFSKLLTTGKHRRTPTLVPTASLSAPRKSFESTSTTDEFFDATEATDRSRGAVVHIDHRGEEEEEEEEEEETPGTEGNEASLRDDSSVSSVEDEEEYTGTVGADGTDAGNLFPVKPKSLAPLPLSETVTRRATIPPSTVLPPSLIAFVRKNVGKDLSTISMPASANEPTSMLQRVAEQLEYADLLDAAVRQATAEERLLYVTAFAISQFSGGRVKERAIRKPFNPLLGETFELLRTEHEVPGGLRLLVEKVSHRPVRLCMQADAAAWSFAQAPAPSQKFWGKSAEITTEGRVRVVLRLPDGREEKYSWALATVFLRNVVMGEKYVEPVGTMHVVNDGTGAKAAVEFRTKGMFGGRSEDVQVETFAGDGAHAGWSLAGTWTQALKAFAPNQPGREIWRVGPLVDDAPRTYGLTRFAASLNEITHLEHGKTAPTDTRLRPDQRFAEMGRLDDAELWKTRLEEGQRARRRQLEERGEEHRPRWFTKVATGPDGDEVWRLKAGKDGYWEERARGTWAGVEDIFNV